MKFKATGEVYPLGLTSDKKFVGLKLGAINDEPLVIEYPVERLAELSLIAVQVASMSAQQMKSTFEPPRLQVAKWSAGSVPETGDIVVKFEYPVAGAHSFLIDRATALALSDGLKEILNRRTGAN